MTTDKEQRHNLIDDNPATAAAFNKRLQQPREQGHSAPRLDK
ncbi:MAG: hypothetical protein V7711_14225 [Pseudomonadales bacterium]